MKTRRVILVALSVALLLPAVVAAQSGDDLKALRQEIESLKAGVGARLVLVEFSDFQCPFCGRHAKQTMPQIEREYVSTGKLLYVMRNLPLESIHPDAFRAASAAECAGDQGKYWQMHEKLFGNQQALSAGDLMRYAQETGLEPSAFKQCMDGDGHAAKIRQDLTDAQAAGVNSTPTFFLGFSEGGGKVKILRRVQGAHPYPVFKAAIEGLLAEGA